MEDIKIPLIPSEKGDAPNVNVQAPRRTRKVGFEHPVVVWIGRICTVCYMVGLYLCWPEISSSWKAKGGTPTNPSFTRPVYHDPALNYTKRELVHFDIEFPAYGPIMESLSITESLGVCQYSYAWNATGRIRLAPGDPEQQYNFMVGMDISGSSQMAIDSVVWPIATDINAMYIRCVEAPLLEGSSMDWDATIRVDVTAFVKPQSLQFGEFKATVGVLDIEIGEGLSYETQHMKLYSAKGNIRGEETAAFTAHEISAVAMNGSITGNWSLPREIVLQTGGWNPLDRSIDIDLIPKMWSSGPYTPGTLSATTQGGDINIRMPSKDNLSLRNMSIGVNSQVGSISGSFVTGGRTDLTTLSGSIDVTLLPYFQLPYTATLFTSTSAGHTKVRVLKPIIDSYYQINPLKNTKSEHSTTSGTLELHYPRQWTGAALGLSETGSVVIEGDRFNTVVQQDHLVVARTDDEIASRLDFSTTTGNGKLVVE